MTKIEYGNQDSKTAPTSVSELPKAIDRVELDPISR